MKKDQSRQILLKAALRHLQTAYHELEAVRIALEILELPGANMATIGAMNAILEAIKGAR